MKDINISVSGGIDSIAPLHENLTEIVLTVIFIVGSNHAKKRNTDGKATMQ